MAAIDRINLHSDPRVEHRNGYLNGYMYHYMYGEPKNYKATILMVSLGLSMNNTKEWCLIPLETDY